MSLANHFEKRKGGGGGHGGGSSGGGSGSRRGISVSVGGTTKSASLLFRLANCSLAEHKAVEQEIKSMVPSKSI